LLFNISSYIKKTPLYKKEVFLFAIPLLGAIIKENISKSMENNFGTKDYNKPYASPVEEPQSKLDKLTRNFKRFGVVLAGFLAFGAGGMKYHEHQVEKTKNSQSESLAEHYGKQLSEMREDLAFIKSELAKEGQESELVAMARAKAGDLERRLANLEQRLAKPGSPALSAKELDGLNKDILSARIALEK
jgi:hypothetical protein